MKKIDRQQVGSHLKDIRKARDYTQAELGENIESSSDYISQIETGRKLPSLEFLVRMAAFYKLSLDELIAYKIDSDISYTEYEKELEEVKRQLATLKPNQLKITHNLITDLKKLT